MLFAEISEAIWLVVIPILAMIVKDYLDQRRIDKKKTDDDAAALAKKTSDDAAALASQKKADDFAKTLLEKQDKNSEALDGKLDAFKKVTAEKDLAEGIRIGREQLQAEINAKIAAAAGVAEVTKSQLPSPTNGGHAALR